MLPPVRVKSISTRAKRGLDQGRLPAGATAFSILAQPGLQVCGMNGIADLRAFGFAGLASWPSDAMVRTSPLPA